VDEMDEFGDAARPAVRQQERRGVRPRGASMQEMNLQAVDRGAELSDVVQARLESPPVVAGMPVVDDIVEVGQRYALIPAAPVRCGAVDRLHLGKARGGQAVA